MPGGHPDQMSDISRSAWRSDPGCRSNRQVGGEEIWRVSSHFVSPLSNATRNAKHLLVSARSRIFGAFLPLPLSRMHACLLVLHAGKRVLETGIRARLSCATLCPHYHDASVRHLGLSQCSLASKPSPRGHDMIIVNRVIHRPNISIFI